MMANNSDAGGVRTLIAVNSKGNIRDTNYNLRLDLDSVRDFLMRTAERYDLVMYGATHKHPGVTPDPGDPGEPDPGEPTPPSSREVYGNLARDYRELATKYEALAAESNGGSSDPGDSSDSGDGTGGPLFTLN